MTAPGYNGWANYETWNLYTLLTSDERTRTKCQEIVDYHRGDESTTTPDGQIWEETAKDVQAYVADVQAGQEEAPR